MHKEASTSPKSCVVRETPVIHSLKPAQYSAAENNHTAAGCVNSYECGTKVVALTHAKTYDENVALPGIVKCATAVDSKMVMFEQSSILISEGVSTIASKVNTNKNSLLCALRASPKLDNCETTNTSSVARTNVESNEGLSLADNVLKKNSNRWFKCGICGVTVAHLKAFETHLSRQHNSKIFTSDNPLTQCPILCNNCKTSFSQKESLLAHLREGCKPDCGLNSMFSCLTCDKSFPTSTDLKNHVANLKHELSWYCFACSKQFLEESVLRIHSCSNSRDDVGRHVDRPLLVCCICSKIFYESKSFTNHTNCCKFSEYCAQCAKRCLSLRDMLEHTKKCGRTAANFFCAVCNLSMQSISVSNRLAREQPIFKHVHCRCCGKCFEDINKDFFDHEATCGVGNHYEQISLSRPIVVWPRFSKAMWAEQCRSCFVLQSTTNSLNKSEKDTQLSKREHCMFCGKCFVEKSAEFVAHEEMCAWIENCTFLDNRKTNGAIGRNANKFKLLKQYLQCQFCGKCFSDHLMEFFNHEAKCKLMHNNSQRTYSSAKSVMQPVSEEIIKHVSKSESSNSTCLISNLHPSTDGQSGNGVLASRAESGNSTCVTSISKLNPSTDSQSGNCVLASRAESGNSTCVTSISKLNPSTDSQSGNCVLASRTESSNSTCLTSVSNLHPSTDSQSANGVFSSKAESGSLTCLTSISYLNPSTDSQSGNGELASRAESGNSTCLTSISNLHPSTDSQLGNDVLASRTVKRLSDKDNNDCCDAAIKRQKWCSKCGHCFLVNLFACHPCKSLRQCMESCYVVVERVDSILSGCESAVNNALPLKRKNLHEESVLPQGEIMTTTLPATKSLVPSNSSDGVTVPVIQVNPTQHYNLNEENTFIKLFPNEATRVEPFEFFPFVSDRHDLKNFETIVENKISASVDTLPKFFETNQKCLDQLSMTTPPHKLKTFINGLRKNRRKTSSLTGSCILDQFVGDLPKIVATHFCKMCKTSFDSEKLYIWHLRTHNEYRPFPCSYCGCKFKRLSNVLEHVRFYHLRGQVPCYKCGKRFANSRLLRKHSKMHTGHYQYKRRKVNPTMPFFEVNRWKKKCEMKYSTSKNKSKKQCDALSMSLDVEVSDPAPSEVPSYNSLDKKNLVSFSENKDFPFIPHADSESVREEDPIMFIEGDSVSGLEPITTQDTNQFSAQKSVTDSEMCSPGNSASTPATLEAERMFSLTERNSHGIKVEEQTTLTQKDEMYMFSSLRSAVYLALSF